MVQQLPVPAVIQRGPGADRPGIVQLPVQRALAMRLQAAPLGDGGLDCQPLLHLAEIDEIPEIDRKAEIAEHRFRYPGIAARVLLVAFDHRGGNVEIRRIGKAPDHLQRRIGLKPEFRTEARGHIAIRVEIPPLVPDRPEMHVTRGIIMPGVAKRQRAG